MCYDYPKCIGNPFITVIIIFKIFRKLYTKNLLVLTETLFSKDNRLE